MEVMSLQGGVILILAVVAALFLWDYLQNAGYAGSKQL